MAVSRAERRWSKEPRMETMLSVTVWLFCSDSLIEAALAATASIACGTPMVFRSNSSPDFLFGRREKKTKFAMRYQILVWW